MSFVYQFIWTPIAVFFVGYLLLRFMGKRAVSEMSSFDLLVTIVLGTAITEPIVTKRLGVAAYYSVIVCIVYYVFARVSLNNKFKKWFHASPTVLIRNGDIDENGLRQTKMTVNELMGELRVNGMAKVQDIEIALMEETGKISVIPKSDVRPIQPSDLNLQVSDVYIPIPIIIDGHVLSENLGYIKKDKGWLETQMKGISKLSTVTLATYDPKSDGLQIDQPTAKTKSGIDNYSPH